MLILRTCLLPAVLFFCCCNQHATTRTDEQKATQQKDTVYTYKKPAKNGIGKVYKGREIAQVMGFSGAGWLERDTRNQEENVQLAVKNLPVDKKSVVADIGAGTGFYTFRIAPKVSKVLAIELQDEALDYLKLRSKELKQNNVEVVKGMEKSPNLPDNSVDLALLVDVYHELEFPQEYLQALYRSLKPGGKIVMLEYRGEDPEVPIKELHKTTEKQITKELAANGFTFVEDKNGLPMQHFLIYQKK
ncbi:class I SAM-dependent methyltransferase [Mucilaginibacter aquatilis]|uniref:Methyltransferase domain-containing protein n=1 Tax=Mucilaginibacter aquatilis TaxID=1517760 RepID=A0A6I4ICT7_9SPHI|nr:class I SAM-dependent methyltransferase [Mucilaginibacter aquatilis]MVN93110.1 methyltransferase domain-containing protein [Mucilaginibacter aquatilis]